MAKSAARRDVLARATNLFFGKFPIHRGKWRLWQLIHPYLRRRGFSSGVYLTSGEFLMDLDPAEYMQFFIYYWGEWEPDESWLVRSVLQPGDRFVDVGANVGYFSLLAACMVGKEGDVIAIEAVPPTAEILAKNIELNGFGNIELHSCAVTDRAGVVRIGRPAHGSMQSSLRLRGGGVSEWEVEAETLDAIIGADRPVRLVKMDVEGAEFLALKGLQGILRRDCAPMVLCEVTDSFLQALGSSAGELFSLMRDSGYAHAYGIHDRRLTPIDIDKALGEFQSNVLFAKYPVHFHT